MKFINKARKFIVILLVTIMVLATSQMIVLGVDDKVVPVVTPRQNGGEVLPGQEIKFKVTDNTKVSYIWYAWNRRTKGEEPKCYELPNEQKEYEYTTNAPKEPGLYEFSIAAQDHYGNVSYWLNIPYIVVNKLSGVVDTKKPTFTFDTPNNYPYHNSTIPQEMEITLQAQDDSGIYYIAYKWTREIVKNDTGATLVFNETNSKSFTAKITAPEEPGYWYLLVYARDGANNLSSTYATGVTIKDTDYTALQGKVDSNEEKFVESDYTPESWQDFKNAITDANNMLKENKSSQKKVDEQTNKIDESITSLQPKEVNKEELDNYINSLVSTDYDNWDDFDHLVTEAKDEGIKLQSEFDKKLQKVKEFTLKAKEIDTSKLDKIEEELAKLDSNDYTEKSWNDIKDKITEAKEQTLQSKFDEKVEEINLDKLVIIPKITNVSTEPQYVPEGHDVTITFETNIELSLSEDHTTATISGEKGTITNDGENKYKITYKVKTEDASKGSISYAIKPVTDNNGEKVEGKEVTGEISIADYMTGIKITKEPDNKQYTIGDKEINLDGGRIRILWASNKKGSLVDMTNEAISVSGFDTTSAGTKTITITYEGLTDTFDIEVMKKDPSKNDLVVTPVTAIYDGTPKAVNVNPKDGIEGLGEVVSIKYCQLVEGAEQSALEGTPTNAGEYKIRVSLAEGEKYKSRNGFEVGTLTIEKADYDMSNVKFEDKTLVYNGEYQEITISGDLPDGVNVTYEHNKRKEVGTRTATAKFTGDSNNYNAIDDMSATITITKATYDMSNVKFLDKTETYNEGTHEIKITGDLPAGVTVEYEGNDKTDVGEYTVTAKFTGGEDKDNYNDIPNMTAKLTIEKATYNMEGIGFADKTETYNGSEHNITLTGNLPKDVLVRYEGNGQIRAGEYTITAIFTGDEKNYNAIPNMTATLKIEKATYDMNSVTFTGKTVTYNGEVQELQIGGGLPEGVEVSYQNNENIEVGEYTVTAKFAGDAENYNLISDMQATLKIEQATPEHIEPGILTAIYGQTLADVKSQLPERFTFQSDLETSVGEVGTRYFSATYTPEDTKNYKIVTDIRVAIRVGKATYAMSGVKFEDKTFTYDGELHSIVVEGQLPDGVEVSYESNERRKSGTSIAKAKFTGDEKNYNAIDDMTATLKVEQATPEYTVPTGLTATYGQKLKDIESQLTEGFEFQDNEEETEVGTVGTNTFKVKYVPTDTTNYKTIENIEVQIEVSKAKPYYKTPEDLKATYGQKLSDVKLPDSKFTFQDELTTPAGNVGENTFLVTYTPDDTNNYEIVKDIEVKITVSKASAPEIIYPTATPIVYGQSLKESTLVGGSIEYGTFAWKASDHIPTAGTGAYIVVFTANDNTTQNYEEITTTQRKVTLEVEKATYDMENITFDGKTVEYTGEVQELAITGDLPAGVKVEYEGNDKKDVGVYTVIAK